MRPKKDHRSFSLAQIRANFRASLTAFFTRRITSLGGFCPTLTIDLIIAIIV
jgi:hypothetical protein